MVAGKLSVFEILRSGEVRMTNFIAFDFCDNDFHDPLREAIIYVVDNRSEDLTLENFRLFVLRGMSAFDALRRVDNEYASRELGNHAQYFKDELEVTEVVKLTDLRDGFEGYVYCKNTYSVFYYGSGLRL
jgi:hypothetical protein